MADVIDRDQDLEEGIPSGDLPQEVEDEIISYLTSELGAVINSQEREGYIQRVKKWTRQREAIPAESAKNVPWEGACFRASADVLTREGWKPVAEVTTSDQVLSRDMETGQIAWQPVTHTHAYPFTGELIHLKNLYYDTAVTPNHEFHLRDKNTGEIKVRTAEQIYNRESGIAQLALPLTGQWEGEEAQEIFGYPADLFLEFLGWYISEGWCFKNRTIGIAQSKEANPENTKAIAGLLEEMGLSYSFRNDSQFLVNVTRELRDYLHSLGTAEGKRIPREVLDLSPEQLWILFDSLVAGDGHKNWARDKHRNVPNVSYYTASEGLAGDVQELCQKLGLSASVSSREPRPGGKIRGRKITGKRVQYTVRLRGQRTTRFYHKRSSAEKIPFNGKVYDVTTAPWHTIYVRENGKPFWSGNSNVVPPLAMINTNGAYSIIKRALGAKKPFITIDTLGEDKTRAKAIERLTSLVVEGRRYMNIRRRNTEIAYLLASLGTQFVKVPWRRDEWNYKYRDPKTGEIKTNIRVEHDSPTLELIPLEDFFTRVVWSDLQRAPWYAERIWLMEHELRQRGASGRFSWTEEVIQRGAGRIPDTRLEELRNAGLEPSDVENNGAYDLFEASLYWDIDGDGIAEDIKIWLDLYLGKILRWELNPMGRRDVFRLPFIERPGNLYAMGVGWIVETLQDEAEALHNMRVDGTKLQAFQMYVTRTGSNIGPREEFFPLKNIQLDNPKEDFLPVKFPDISQGTFQAELLTKQYADRATGVSDALMGFHEQGDNSRKTASGTMFLANQSASVMDSIMEGVEDVFGEIAELIVLHLLYHPQRTQEIAGVLSREDQQEIDSFLQQDPNELVNTFRFSIQSTEQDKTMEARKQQMMTMVQLYSMYGQQIWPLVQMIYDPSGQVPGEIKQIAVKFFTGSTNLIDKIFHAMEHPETEDYLPYIKDLEMMNSQIEAMKDQKIAGIRRQQMGGANAGEAGSGR